MPFTSVQLPQRLVAVTIRSRCAGTVEACHPAFCSGIANAVREFVAYSGLAPRLHSVTATGDPSRRVLTAKLEFEQNAMEDFILRYPSGLVDLLQPDGTSAGQAILTCKGGTTLQRVQLRVPPEWGRDALFSFVEGQLRMDISQLSATYSSVCHGLPCSGLWSATVRTHAAKLPAGWDGVGVEASGVRRSYAVDISIMPLPCVFAPVPHIPPPPPPPPCSAAPSPLPPVPSSFPPLPPHLSSFVPPPLSPPAAPAVAPAVPSLQSQPSTSACPPPPPPLPAPPSSVPHPPTSPSLTPPGLCKLVGVNAILQQRPQPSMLTPASPPPPPGAHSRGLTGTTAPGGCVLPPPPGTRQPVVPGATAHGGGVSPTVQPENTAGPSVRRVAVPKAGAGSPVGVTDQRFGSAALQRVSVGLMQTSPSAGVVGRASASISPSPLAIERSVGVMLRPLVSGVARAATAPSPALSQNAWQVPDRRKTGAHPKLGSGSAPTPVSSRFAVLEQPVCGVDRMQVDLPFPPSFGPKLASLSLPPPQPSAMQPLVPRPLPPPSPLAPPPSDTRSPQTAVCVAPVLQPPGAVHSPGVASTAAAAAVALPSVSLCPPRGAVATAAAARLPVLLSPQAVVAATAAVQPGVLLSPPAAAAMATAVESVAFLTPLPSPTAAVQPAAAVQPSLCLPSPLSVVAVVQSSLPLPCPSSEIETVQSTLPLPVQPSPAAAVQCALPAATVQSTLTLPSPSSPAATVQSTLPLPSPPSPAAAGQCTVSLPSLSSPAAAVQSVLPFLAPSSPAAAVHSTLSLPSPSPPTTTASVVHFVSRSPPPSPRASSGIEELTERQLRILSAAERRATQQPQPMQVDVHVDLSILPETNVTFPSLPSLALAAGVLGTPPQATALVVWDGSLRYGNLASDAQPSHTAAVAGSTSALLGLQGWIAPVFPPLPRESGDKRARVAGPRVTMEGYGRHRERLWLERNGHSPVRSRLCDPVGFVADRATYAAEIPAEEASADAAAAAAAIETASFLFDVHFGTDILPPIPRRLPWLAGTPPATRRPILRLPPGLGSQFDVGSSS